MKAGLIAIAMASMTTAALAEPINLRCANLSVRSQNPNAYYAIVTVDLDAKKIVMVAHRPGGSNTFNHDIAEFDEHKVSAVGFDMSAGPAHAQERRIVLDRLSGRLALKIKGSNDTLGWTPVDFDCQPAKRVF